MKREKGGHNVYKSSKNAKSTIDTPRWTKRQNFTSKNNNKIREREYLLVFLLAKEGMKEAESQSAESDLELKMGPF